MDNKGTIFLTYWIFTHDLSDQKNGYTQIITKSQFCIKNCYKSNHKQNNIQIWQLLDHKVS